MGRGAFLRLQTGRTSGVAFPGIVKKASSPAAFLLEGWRTIGKLLYVTERERETEALKTRETRAWAHEGSRAWGGGSGARSARACVRAARTTRRASGRERVRERPGERALVCLFKPGLVFRSVPRALSTPEALSRRPLWQSQTPVPAAPPTKEPLGPCCLVPSSPSSWQARFNRRHGPWSQGRGLGGSSDRGHWSGRCLFLRRSSGASSREEGPPACGYSLHAVPRGRYLLIPQHLRAGAR